MGQNSTLPRGDDVRTETWFMAHHSRLDKRLFTKTGLLAVSHYTISGDIAFVGPYPCVEIIVGYNGWKAQMENDQRHVEHE